MSVAAQFAARRSILASPGLVAPGALLSNQMTVRFTRKEVQKMKKPEDKSTVILGKIKSNRPYSRAGVSDKQYPVLMKWERPVRIETCNPQISGDIGGLEFFGPVDMTQPPVELEGCSQLEEAPSDVKRVLSLEYARNKDVINKMTHDLVKTVQRHPRDFDSLEVKIALQTIMIRNLQRDLIERYPYKNQPVKHVLTFKIAARRKNIERLRQQDYKRYEWVLEKLNLFYKPVPKYDAIEVSRRSSLERLTDMWCDELKKHRLTSYRKQLEAEQPKFLREKADKLRFIMTEEKDLGLEPSVTEEEIAACLRRAEELEQKLAEKLEQGEEEEDEYLIYREEKDKDKNIYLS